MPPAIRIEGVGKRYWLGVGYHGHGNFSQALEDKVRAPLRRVVHRAPRAPREEASPSDDLWALRDVSFDIEEGTVMGLIGANGAGKSTLLKILARITAPTEGRVTMRGRVGSLLEVGTGFHPELTGRENVFLNGAILGMRRQEIASRFDEIVEFSGIERFIDTPVKRYSSGMFVRLAFSVAAHLENDILLLDEVLAVGDAEFQRKCLEKIDETVADGRTVVFVSHGISNVLRLCERCAWIEDGRVAAIGHTGDVASQYFKNVTETPQTGEAVIPDDFPRQVGVTGAQVRRVRVTDHHGNLLSNLHFGQPFSVVLSLEVTEPITDVVFEVGLNSVDGARVVTAQNIDAGGSPRSFEPGIYDVQAEFDVTLLPGDFTIDVGVADVNTGHNYEFIQRVLTFTVLHDALEGDDHYPSEVVRGSVRPRSEWFVHSAKQPAAAVSEAPE